MATSGSFSTGKYGGVRGLTFNWWRTGYSVEGNYSDISWNFTGMGSSSGTWYYTKNGYLDINGSRVWTQASDSRVQLDVGTVLASGSTRIYHNSDGTKSFSASGGAGIYSYGSAQTGSGTWTLDTIPRASQPSIITYPNTTDNIGDIGSTVTVHMNKKAAFTHKVYAVFGNYTQQIASAAVDNCSWTISNDFMDQIPNAVDGRGTLYVETYNGTTKIGTKSVGFYCTVPSSVVPTVSAASAGEGNSSISSLSWGTMVKDKSYLSISITASGIRSSTIKKYYCKYEGTELSDSSVSALNNQLKTKSLTVGTRSIEVWVTDSRGRASAHTTKSYEVTDYTAPNISSYSVERCNSSGTSTDDGTYLKVIFAGSTAAVKDKNPMTVRVGYKLKTASTYTYVTYVNASKTVHSFDYTGSSRKIIGDSTGIFKADKSYDIIFEVSDQFSTLSRSRDIATGFDLMHFNSSGKALAIGKKSETDNTFEVGLNSEFSKRTSFTYGMEGKTLSGGGGTTGYMQAFSITTTGTYQNQAIVFDVLQRNRFGSCRIVLTSSATTGTVTVNQIHKEGNINIYYTCADNVLTIFIQKSEGYDNINICNIRKGSYMDKTSINWINTTIASLPSGYVTIEERIGAFNRAVVTGATSGSGSLITSGGVYDLLNPIKNVTTSEQLIGTWNGKNLYRRMYVSGNCTKNATATIASGLSNVTMINIYGVAKGASHSIPINFWNTSHVFCHMAANGGNITFANAFENSVFYITVEYIKN